jgi:hypothetical protein
MKKGFLIVLFFINLAFSGVYDSLKLIPVIIRKSNLVTM